MSAHAHCVFTLLPSSSGNMNLPNSVSCCTDSLERDIPLTNNDVNLTPPLSISTEHVQYIMYTCVINSLVSLRIFTDSLVWTGFNQSSVYGQLDCLSSSLAALEHLVSFPTALEVYL